MLNPLHKLLQNKAAARVPHHARRVHRLLTGIARDFWKDGTEDTRKRHSNSPKKKPSAPASPVFSPPPVIGQGASLLWHAVPGEISEKMWGEGFIMPGGPTLLDMMLKPLGLDKKSTVLSLSGGVGAILHKITAELDASLTCLEPDPAIAIRANELLVHGDKGHVDAITYYTPATFEPTKTVTKIYDCVFAREIFYRVEDKRKFFTAIAACTEPQAQLSFTDYIVNPEDKDKPAIAAWMAHEEGATPLGLVAMAEAWAMAGFNLRVHDDQTAFYRKETLAGLQRFTKFIATGMRPDEETKQAVLRRLDLWAHRLAAMEQGMKFFRFYATK